VLTRTASHELDLVQGDRSEAFAATCDESHHTVQTDAVGPIAHRRQQGSSIRPNGGGSGSVIFERSFLSILCSAKLSSVHPRLLAGSEGHKGVSGIAHRYQASTVA